MASETRAHVIAWNELKEILPSCCFFENEEMPTAKYAYKALHPDDEVMPFLQRHGSLSMYNHGVFYWSPSTPCVMNHYLKMVQIWDVCVDYRDKCNFFSMESDEIFFVQDGRTFMEGGYPIPYFHNLYLTNSHKLRDHVNGKEQQCCSFSVKMSTVNCAEPEYMVEVRSHVLYHGRFWIKFEEGSVVGRLVIFSSTIPQTSDNEPPRNDDLEKLPSYLSIGGYKLNVLRVKQADGENGQADAGRRNTGSPDHPRNWGLETGARRREPLGRSLGDFIVIKKAKSKKGKRGGRKTESVVTTSDSSDDSPPMMPKIPFDMDKAHTPRSPPKMPKSPMDMDRTRTPRLPLPVPEIPTDLVETPAPWSPLTMRQKSTDLVETPAPRSPPTLRQTSTNLVETHTLELPPPTPQREIDMDEILAPYIKNLEGLVQCPELTEYGSWQMSGHNEHDSRKSRNIEEEDPALKAMAVGSALEKSLIEQWPLVSTLEMASFGSQMAMPGSFLNESETAEVDGAQAIVPRRAQDVCSHEVQAMGPSRAQEVGTYSAQGAQAMDFSSAQELSRYAAKRVQAIGLSSAQETGPYTASELDHRSARREQELGQERARAMGYHMAYETEARNVQHSDSDHQRQRPTDQDVIGAALNAVNDEEYDDDNNADRWLDDYLDENPLGATSEGPIVTIGIENSFLPPPEEFLERRQANEMSLDDRISEQFQRNLIEFDQTAQEFARNKIEAMEKLKYHAMGCSFVAEEIFWSDDDFEEDSHNHGYGLDDNQRNGEVNNIESFVWVDESENIVVPPNPDHGVESRDNDEEQTGESHQNSIDNVAVSVEPVDVQHELTPASGSPNSSEFSLLEASNDEESPSGGHDNRGDYPRVSSSNDGLSESSVSPGASRGAVLESASVDSDGDDEPSLGDVDTEAGYLGDNDDEGGETPCSDDGAGSQLSGEPLDDHHWCYVDARSESGRDDSSDGDSRVSYKTSNSETESHSEDAVPESSEVRDANNAQGGRHQDDDVAEVIPEPPMHRDEVENETNYAPGGHHQDDVVAEVIPEPPMPRVEEDTNNSPGSLHENDGVVEEAKAEAAQSPRKRARSSCAIC